MKNIYKILLLLFVTAIITGCSASADIVINYDGTVTESIDVTNENSKIKYGNKSIEDSIDLFLMKYNTALEVGEYGTEIHVGNDNSGAIINRNYDDICKLVDNTIFSQYIYNKIDCIEDDDYYEIKSVGQVVRSTDRYDTWLAPNYIKLTITLPIVATEQNADETDGNTYIWRYDENTRDKSFYLKISKSALEQGEAEYNANVSRKKAINTVLVVVGVVALLAIIGFVGVVLYKKYQRNKLDY